MTTSIYDNAAARGVYFTPGPRDNITDCEHDIIAVHLRTGETRRFHGTLYNDRYSVALRRWVESFPADDEMGAIIGRIQSAKRTADDGRGWERE